VPRTGHIISFDVGALDMLTQIGPMARFVEDLTLTLPLITGVDWRDPALVPMPLGDPGAVDLEGLHAAFYTDNDVVSPTPETAETVQQAADALSDAGAAVVEDRPTEAKNAVGLWMDLATADGGDWVRRLLQAVGTTEVHPVIKTRFLSREAVSSADFSQMFGRWSGMRAAMTSFMENYDVMLCPVNAYPAMSHETAFDQAIGWSYTRIYNLTGWPVAVVRGGTSPEGLPIGVQIVARPWREDVALAVAQLIETSLGGWQRPVI
jgi:amidase